MTVALIESWGSDERVIESARMSTGGSFRGWDQDAKLLRYLWKNQHTSPFEMCGATFEVRVPIFVAREWMRHRTQSYNEFSSRYSRMPDEAYVPSVERILRRSDNKQAGGEAECTEAAASTFREDLARLYSEAQAVYDRALRNGIPRELARLCLPVGRSTVFRTSANLLNWFRFLRLRLADGAQEEIRLPAREVLGHLSGKFPRTVALFYEGL